VRPHLFGEVSEFLGLVRTARCRRSKKLTSTAASKLPTTPTATPTAATPATATPTAAVPTAAAPADAAPTAAAPTTATAPTTAATTATTPATAAVPTAPTPTGGGGPIRRTWHIRGTRSRPEAQIRGVRRYRLHNRRDGDNATQQEIALHWLPLLRNPMKSPPSVFQLTLFLSVSCSHKTFFEKLVNNQIRIWSAERRCARSVGACLDEVRCRNPIRTFRRCRMWVERLAGDLMRPTLRHAALSPPQRILNVLFWHKLDPLLGGTFRGRQPTQFGTFLTQRSHSCIAANYPSFDHLVGCRKERRRHGEA